MPAGFYRLKVDKIIRETPEAVQIRFLVPPPLKNLFTYRAGQYLTLHATINGEEIRRSYSVCESPYVDDMPTVAVKEVENGRMSTFLNRQLQEGDLIEDMPPMGNFTVDLNDQAQRHFILFGGGSGITPLKSILMSVLLKEPNSKITLIYANRDEASIIFREALDTLEQTYASRFKIIHVLDEAGPEWTGLKGMLNEMKVNQLVKMNETRIAEAEYYICGPGGLMQLVKSSLENMGIPGSHIHLEYFAAVKSDEAKSTVVEDDGSEKIVTIDLFGDEMDVTVKPNQTILEAAQEAAMDPPYSCTVGVCTTCRAKVHEGTVRMDEREGLSDAEIDEGYVLTCQSHPTSSRVKLTYE